MSHEIVLLVIAHPDDEAMFFVPMLVRMKQKKVRLCVLCLSTGDAAGLGAIRFKIVAENIFRFLNS